MSSIQIGRLTLGGPATAFSEQVGDPVGQQGGAVVAAPRTASYAQAQLVTIQGSGTTLAQAQTYRRQLRSLLGNTPLKLGAFLYLIYDDDEDLNGWYVPDQTSLAPIDKASWLAKGLWQTGSSNWFKLGSRRTHREARQVWAKDLRTGLWARDYRGWVLSSDFAALPALTLSYLVDYDFINDVSDSVTGGVVTGQAMPQGRDGGECMVIDGLADLAVVAYARPEADMLLGDVIAYDRQGQITAPAAGPDTDWEEFYGPDWPYSWLAPFPAPNDMPVLDNGLVRVRYTAAGNWPGVSVDVWNGTGYVEQGTMSFQRDHTGSGSFEPDTGWLSARLVEWTPERAVAHLVLYVTGDAASREDVYVTVQRGRQAVKFECYPAPLASGSSTAAQLVWFTAPTDANDSVFVSDSQTSPSPAGSGVIVATAQGGGTGEFTDGSVIASFAAAENFVSLLRSQAAYNTVGAYQATLCALQASAVPSVGNVAGAYITATNYVAVRSPAAAGWVGAVLSFCPTEPDQVNEAEAIRNAASATTSQVADSTASGGQCVQDTQTAQTAPTLKRAVGTLTAATYRCFARVKVTSGNTGSFQWASAGGGSGYVVTSTSTSWTWIDLGDATVADAPAEIDVYAWRSAGSAIGVYVDRVELFLVSDPSPAQFEGQGNIPAYQGCRDQAQAALVDSRMLGCLVARA